MTPEQALTLIINELESREIHAVRSGGYPSGTVGLALKASAAQRFLDALVAAPLDRDDDLVHHIAGHGAELEYDEEPWTWEGAIALRAMSLLR